jgi:hypothetical protein
MKALYAFAESAGLAFRVRVMRAGLLTLELDPYRGEPISDLTASSEEQKQADLEALLWATGAGATPFVRDA